MWIESKRTGRAHSFAEFPIVTSLLIQLLQDDGAEGKETGHDD